MASKPTERSRRRKGALACEPCRDRKSRCDGGAPICSACHRRGLTLDSCIYKLDNARTASNEAYIRALHDRIRSLKKTCKDHDVPLPPISLDGQQATLEAASGARQQQELGDEVGNKSSQTPARTQHIAYSTERNDGQPDGSRPTHQQPIPTGQLSPLNTTGNPRHGSAATLPLDMLPVAPADDLDSPDTSSRVTAMGTLSSSDGNVTSALKGDDEFYGTSSAAFFIKETYGSMDGNVAGRVASASGGLGGLDGNPSVDLLRATHTLHFSLPPRFVADRLLNEFWRRVYYLYPVFHRPTFEKAYRSLWEDSREADMTESNDELGLGSLPGAGPATIVFHCALNTIFALGCLFLDSPVRERSNAIQVYFLRAKHFIGLDFLDMNNIGVVQSLLLMTLFLQSTPFASRCWNAVGIACPVAQGLGLHTEPEQGTRSLLEMEIRKRAWHGCVVLDRLVSMTFGRPTMTLHLPRLELPSITDHDFTDGANGDGVTQGVEPSRYVFNMEHIRLCNILGEILAQVFQYSSNTAAVGQSTSRFDETQNGLDTALALDARLSAYARMVHPNLSWMHPRPLTSATEDIRPILEMQRNVLHVRFLYFRLMLHRPTLTRVCTASNTGPTPGLSDAGPAVYESCSSECAKICMQSPMQLLDVLYRIYKTPSSTGWWWAGLYASTAGLVLLIGRSHPVLETSIGRRPMDQSWQVCQNILNDLSSMSPSAQRSLKVLQTLDVKLASRTRVAHVGSEPLEMNDSENSTCAVPNLIPDRQEPRDTLTGFVCNTLDDQFVAGRDCVSFISHGVRAQEFPDFSTEGAFINWDQVMGYMSDAPGYSESFY